VSYEPITNHITYISFDVLILIGCYLYLCSAINLGALTAVRCACLSTMHLLAYDTTVCSRTSHPQPHQSVIIIITRIADR